MAKYFVGTIRYRKADMVVVAGFVDPVLVLAFKLIHDFEHSQIFKTFETLSSGQVSRPCPCWSTRRPHRQPDRRHWSSTSSPPSFASGWSVQRKRWPEPRRSAPREQGWRRRRRTRSSSARRHFRADPSAESCIRSRRSCSWSIRSSLRRFLCRSRREVRGSKSPEQRSFGQAELICSRCTRWGSCCPRSSEGTSGAHPTWPWWSGQCRTCSSPRWRTRQWFRLAKSLSGARGRWKWRRAERGTPTWGRRRTRPRRASFQSRKWQIRRSRRLERCQSRQTRSQACQRGRTSSARSRWRSKWLRWWGERRCWDSKIFGTWSPSAASSTASTC